VGGGFAYAVQASTGDAERETAFAGTVIGWTLGSTIGIHLANRREGNLAKLLAGSYLLAAGVAILAVNTDSEGLFIPFAMLQLGGGIVAAQGTHRDGTR
jgi:hypothetical protein